MLIAKSAIHLPSSLTLSPQAEWTSPVLSSPGDAQSKACFVYDVDVHSISRVAAKLLFQTIDDPRTVYSRQLFRSTYHTVDNMEIELKGVASYQVRCMLRLFTNNTFVTQVWDVGYAICNVD